MMMPNQGILLLLLLANGVAWAQDCPHWRDKSGALQFLLANKAHSTEVDPQCVMTAFASLSDDAASAPALVGLLDFERSTKSDDFKTLGKRYPAIGVLFDIGKPAVPYLIRAIKESSSEIVRTNAAHTLASIHRPCVRAVMGMLDAEANKSEMTAEQVQRLAAARDYIGNLYPPCDSGKPGQ